MNLGKTLQDLRKEKNISQEDIADILNVSRQTISNWENSKKLSRYTCINKTMRYIQNIIRCFIKRRSATFKSHKKRKTKKE